MTEDLLPKYYDMEELDQLLRMIATDTGARICESARLLGIKNQNWRDEQLVENMVKSDHQLIRRFCDILITTDDEMSRRASEKMREILGI